MRSHIILLFLAAVQPAGGGERGGGEGRRRREEGGGRETVTCRRTHMVLLRRNTDYRDQSDPGRSRSPRQGLSASINNKNNNKKVVNI